ncbi:hypothetical protein ABID21_003809 [Pseudorhizobium tarimense]|uniref:Uncharacterized protein n=1 Tax=Pseudorhizobium tarimense TaxID=1079109 RepID=A0ABV2HAX5_9HYPH
MQIADAEGGIFLGVIALEEALRTPEGIMDVKVAGHRCHGTKLLTEIEAKIRRLDIGVAEVDQGNDVRMIKRSDRIGNLRRRLPILPRLGGEDVFKSDANAIGPGELGKLQQRLTLAHVGRRSLMNLVRAQASAVLNQNPRTNPIADSHQCLGRAKLIAAGGCVHQIGRDETVDGIAEVELPRQRDEPLQAILDYPAASDEVETGEPSSTVSTPILARWRSSSSSEAISPSGEPAIKPVATMLTIILPPEANSPVAPRAAASCSVGTDCNAAMTTS